MDYKCPKCNENNKLTLFGKDYGIFNQKCKKCYSTIEIEISNEQKIVNINFNSESKIKNDEKSVPADYKKITDTTELLKKNKKEKKRLVSIISLLILSASIMGLVTGGALYYSPDEFPEYDEIKIEIVIKNSTSNIENATILINDNNKESEYLGNGSYQFLLKPGKYIIKIEVKNHTNANAEIYIPPQDNNLSLVDYNQGLEGVNLFTFELKEGTGEETLDSNAYSTMIRWCPGLMFIFSMIGIWGAWTTYNLQSYKNAQIGAFFSILAMGFFVIGPILGMTALFLLPKIKKFFTVPFKN